MADTSTPAGRKREAALIAAGEAAEGADIPAEQLNRVKAAADVAQASEFVARMDGGYSAAIAQGGSNVSGGQKQRLSIARAVYRHPEILIFDDSFSALDFKTDREVRDVARPRGQGFHQAHRGPAHRHHHERRPHRRARRRQGRGSGHAQGTARQLRRIPPRSPNPSSASRSLRHRGGGGGSSPCQGLSRKGNSPWGCSQAKTS